MNEILEWRNDSKKKDGMKCLRIMFMNVYGMEMKQEMNEEGGEEDEEVDGDEEDNSDLESIHNYDSSYTVRRMREVGKNEGKEDSEGRREWERRWREVGDVMNEEDVMETSIMHLCIPDYKQKEKDGLIVPSECSLNALSVLLYEKSNRECAYHFPVFDINDEPSNVVIIRTLQSGFYLYSSDRVKNMIENVSKTVSIHQSHGVVRVTFDNTEDASRVAERINGWKLSGRRLSFTQGKREDEYGTIPSTCKYLLEHSLAKLWQLRLRIPRMIEAVKQKMWEKVGRVV